jgi:hypothetical protein
VRDFVNAMRAEAGRGEIFLCPLLLGLSFHFSHREMVNTGWITLLAMVVTMTIADPNFSVETGIQVQMLVGDQMFQMTFPHRLQQLRG